MAQKCTRILWRMDIVFNILTGEVGDVACDSFGLPRALIPVRVNTHNGVKPYRIDWRAQDCIHLKGTWADAWLELRRMRDIGGWQIEDPRLGLPEEISLPEVA